MFLSIVDFDTVPFQNCVPAANQYLQAHHEDILRAPPSDSRQRGTAPLESHFKFPLPPFGGKGNLQRGARGDSIPSAGVWGQRHHNTHGVFANSGLSPGTHFRNGIYYKKQTAAGLVPSFAFSSRYNYFVFCSVHRKGQMRDAFVVSNMKFLSRLVMLR